MFKASLYIVACSARNRFLVRLRRLREPRYLIGALFAAAYFYFTLIVPRRAARRRPGNRGLPSLPALEQYAVALGAAAMFLFAGLSWILPSKSTLLQFSDAETDFLFPAPASRRQLLVHRLMRSQLGLLFAAMIPAFVFTGAGESIAGRLRRGIALWVCFATVRVYYAGVTMARERLTSADRRVLRVAWAPLVVTLMMAGVVSVPAVHVARASTALALPDLVAQLGDAMATGLAGAVLLPVRILLAPVFADGIVAFATSLAGALAVLLVTIAWVVKSDAVFHGAPSAEGFRTAPVRPARAAPRRRGLQWALPLSGRVETMFFWKNAMQTLRNTSLKSVAPFVIPVVFGMVTAAAGISRSQNRGIAASLCVAALLLAAMATLLGPLSVTSDLRGDLKHLEVLKTWPVKGGALIRGEMLWPGVLLTMSAWLALTCAIVLSQAAFPRLALGWRLSLGAAALIVVPAFIFAQYTIHHAAVVIFPAWVPSDNEMRGFDTMAQRLILFAGVALALVAMIGPGAIAGGVMGLLFYRLTGSPLVLVPAALTCLAVVSVEVLVASEALGPAYDRIDLTGVERAG